MPSAVIGQGESSSYSKSLIALPSAANNRILSPPLDRLVLLANFPRTGRSFPKRCSKASLFSIMSALFPDSMTRELPVLKSKSIPLSKIRPLKSMLLLPIFISSMYSKSFRLLCPDSISASVGADGR